MKKLVVLFTLFFSFQFSYSSSILGGEFTWDCIGQDSFMITLSLYNDCNGDKPGDINIDVYCKDAQKLKTLNIQTPPPVDITATCNNAKTICEDPNSNFPFGMEKYTYQKLMVLDHSLTCCEILLTFQECCRSSNIDNGGAGTVFYTDAMLNRCVIPCDNSPRGSNSPIAIICKDQPIYLCSCMHDFDIGPKGGLLDSSGYELVCPQDTNGNIEYEQLHDYNKPLVFDGFPNADLPLPKGFHIEGRAIRFTPIKVENVIFREKISEYRDGKLIGYLHRDYYVAVIDCPVSSVPQIVSDNFFTSVFPGDTAKIIINSYDLDIEDTLDFWWDLKIPGAIWTQNAYNVKHPTVTISWTPTMDDISPIPYNLVVSVRDDHCPINQKDTRAFQILVKDPNAGLEEDAESDFKIYPNPTSSKINIISQRNIEQIELFDLTGKVLIQKQNIGLKSFQLDVSGFQNGIYFLRLDGVVFQKIVVE
jgi:hypothetical protein